MAFLKTATISLVMLSAPAFAQDVADISAGGPSQTLALAETQIAADTADDGADASRRDPRYNLASARLAQRDFAGAAGPLRSLADGGDVWAMRSLARLHIHGQGVARDTDTAISLLRRAAMLGDHQSALALGVAYARSGQAGEARLWLGQALTSDSEHVRIDARRVLSRLD